MPVTHIEEFLTEVEIVCPFCAAKLHTPGDGDIGSCPHLVAFDIDVDWFEYEAKLRPSDQVLHFIDPGFPGVESVLVFRKKRKE